MEIILLGQTVIDWQRYVDFCQSVNGELPTRAIDSSKRKFNPLLTFVLTLNELCGIVDEPVRTIRRGHLLLDTVQILFLVRGINFDWYGCVKKFDLLNHISLLCGTLREWKDTILTNLYSKEPEHRLRRECFTTILGLLEVQDYRLVWDDYAHETLQDGTLILRKK